MKNPIFCTYGDSKALCFAKKALVSWGYPLLEAPDPAVTHLLLPVPYSKEVPTCGPDTVVFGGFFEKKPKNAVNFLELESYLQENAAITAQCAVKLLPTGSQKILIIGNGRIGKCLASLLPEAEMAARQPRSEEEILLRDVDLTKYDIIINTAPAPIFQEQQAKPGCFLLDLASQPGISGENVRWARGLPGKMAPEQAGLLMARTALRIALEKE